MGLNTGINGKRWRYLYGVSPIDGKKKTLHRIAMENHLGRVLLRSEHVHHINGDTTDNRIENLKIVSASEHYLSHAEEYKKAGKGWGMGRRIAEGLDYWTPKRRKAMELRRKIVTQIPPDRRGRPEMAPWGRIKIGVGFPASRSTCTRLNERYPKMRFCSRNVDGRNIVFRCK